MNLFKTLAGSFSLALLFACTSPGPGNTDSKSVKALRFDVTLPAGETGVFRIGLECEGWNVDSMTLCIPAWMPGYYQVMNYADEISEIKASLRNGESLQTEKTGPSTWKIKPGKGNPFRLTYRVRADRNFVACNFTDSSHAYFLPVASLFYIDGALNTPSELKFIMPGQWKDIATGLTPVPGTKNEFTAKNFDELYDCPILAGNLDEFPSFRIKGVEHRFIAWNPGQFDRATLMNDLEKAVGAAIDLFGEIPYERYTFIGIGPGYGGIEHLNNTAVSFYSNELDRPEVGIRMLSYLIHEYFHNFNVKRIRPYELGPFDYSRENSTNLLWVSEGLSVYYEYLLLRRAGLISEEELLQCYAGDISTFENDPGKKYQSIAGASYETWSDGPFGQRGGEDCSISYYEKGPGLGLVLDLAIRKASGNKRSLDDVFRLVYRRYYKDLGRGFTDAEFRSACEEVAGAGLGEVYRYVYTTDPIDYNRYLSYAGLRLESESGRQRFSIKKMQNLSPEQQEVLNSWEGK